MVRASPSDIPDIGVCTRPGATQLTRIPSGPHSAAETRVNIWIAAFDAE